MPIKLHPQSIGNGKAGQRQNARVDERRSHASHDKIIRDQEIRFPDQCDHTRQDLIHRLQKKRGHDKIHRYQGQHQKLPVPWP